MAKIEMDHPYVQSCPIRNILSRIGDKWSILVLMTLSQDENPLRFRDLQNQIPDISQKVLTSTLRTLEDDGFVARTVYPEVPPRVEYALTERAHSLIPHINGLVKWAADNMIAIMTDRAASNS